jgi:hypothetical protein
MHHRTSEGMGSTSPRLVGCLLQRASRDLSRETRATFLVDCGPRYCSLKRQTSIREHRLRGDQPHTAIIPAGYRLLSVHLRARFAPFRCWARAASRIASGPWCCRRPAGTSFNLLRRLRPEPTTSPTSGSIDPWPPWTRTLAVGFTSGGSAAPPAAAAVGRSSSSWRAVDLFLYECTAYGADGRTSVDTLKPLVPARMSASGLIHLGREMRAHCVSSASNARPKLRSRPDRPPARRTRPRVPGLSAGKSRHRQRTGSGRQHRALGFGARQASSSATRQRCCVGATR